MSLVFPALEDNKFLLRGESLVAQDIKRMFKPLGGILHRFDHLRQTQLCL